MNTKHINIVLTVLREGSITAASKKLFVSQPALSQTIKQIEMDLGAPLFDRNTDPISLTAVGSKYVEAAQQIVDIERNLRSEIAETKKEIHGRLIVGLSVQRGLKLLPQVIPEFAQRYPYIKVELVEHGSATIERLTSEGQCDIAFIATNEKPNRLHYFLLENEEVVLMAARTTDLAHRFRDGEPISITDAIGERFVSMNDGHSVRAIQDRLFDHYHISPSILLETRNMEAGKNVAARSNAVMLIPQVYVSNSPELQYSVQCHPLIKNDYERHFYLVYRKGMHLTRYMEDFVRIVCQKMEIPCILPGVD